MTFYTKIVCCLGAEYVVVIRLFIVHLFIN